MHRFYLAPQNWDELVLIGSEAHHAQNVLRLKPHDRVVVFNGRGREITAEIETVSRNGIQLRKLHETRVPPLRCHITLAQAIPKGKKMDLIVQKAVEIGAAEIAPISSERTIVRLSSGQSRQKHRKWEQVAVEAAKQCGQNWVPVVREPQSLREFFSSAPGLDLQLIGSLQTDALHLKAVLANFERENQRRPSSVLMCIGPEGDFTPAELGLARGHGCHPITLGPIILRVETAAVYCLSVLSYELLA